MNQRSPLILHRNIDVKAFDSASTGIRGCMATDCLCLSSLVTRASNNVNSMSHCRYIIVSVSIAVLSCQNIQWKTRVALIPTLLSLVAPGDVVMTACGVIICYHYMHIHSSSIKVLHVNAILHCVDIWRYPVMVIDKQLVIPIPISYLYFK